MFPVSPDGQIPLGGRKEGVAKGVEGSWEAPASKCQRFASKTRFIHARVRANGLEATQYSVVPHVEYIQQIRTLAGNFVLMKKLQQSLGNPRLLRTRPPTAPQASLLCEAISQSPPAFPSVR